MGLSGLSGLSGLGNSGAGGPFDFTSVETMIFDLDTRYELTPGTGIASWDSVIGSYPQVQATGSKQPTLEAANADFGGMPTMNYNAAASQTTVGNFPDPGNQYTIFMVAEVPNIDGACAVNAYEHASGGNQGIRIYTEGSGANAHISLEIKDDTTGTRSISQPVDTPKRGVFAMRAGATQFHAFFNGVQETSNWGNNGGTNSPISYSGTNYAVLDRLRLGSLVDVFWYFNGKIARFFVYSAALTDEQIALVTAELQALYGLA